MDHATPTWTHARLELVAWFDRNGATSLAELYRGAVELIYETPLAGRTRFVGHAVREIRNRLPGVITNSARVPRLDYVKRMDTIAKAWRDANLHLGAMPTGEEFESPARDAMLREGVEIPRTLQRLIDELVADHLGVKETRAQAAERFFEVLAPENRDLRATLRPIVSNWMAVTEWFMDRTHDSGRADAACDEHELRRKFEQFESVMGSLIRAFFASLDELDRILASSDVGRVDDVVSLIARAEQYRYFFDKLDDPRWIAPLAAKGFFKRPPPPIPVEGGKYARVLVWPESRLLARLAPGATEPQKEEIVSLASELPETDNPSVHQDVVDIALAVPPTMAVRLASKAKKWAGRPEQFFIPTKLGELATHLARGDHTKEALSILRPLLALRRNPEDRRQSLLYEPRGRISDWHYKEILETHVPPVAERGEGAVLNLLGGLLATAVRGSQPDGGRRGARGDYSAIWRPAIEEHEQNESHHDPRSLLVDAVRDSALRMVAKAPEGLCQVVEDLERRELDIFDRIALHVLRVRGELAPALVAERLTDKCLYESSEHRHEYTLLLRDWFSRLADEGRSQILGWIADGPDVVRFSESHERVTGERARPEDVDAFREHWRLERLWPIREHLVEPWAGRLAALVGRFGEPEHPEFQHFTWVEDGTTLEGRSPKTREELRAMSPEDVARYVGEWREPETFRGPTREGLRFVLRRVVSEEPEKFAQAAPRFGNESPFFVHTVLEGLREAVVAGRAFTWPPVLTLSELLTSESGAGPPSSGESRTILVAIVELLHVTFERNDVPLALESRDQVWSLLECLVARRQMLQGGDPDRSDAERLDAAPFSRSPRVQLLEAVVAYALWVARDLATRHSDPETRRHDFDSIPEVRRMLETILESGGRLSLEERAQLGRSVAWLAALDLRWLEENRDRVFPLDETRRPELEAAWRGFILWNRPTRPLFPILHPLYRMAVDRIQLDASNTQHEHPDTQLARHLMILFWHGEVESDDEEGLIARFFAKAPDALRAEAVRFVGASLRQEQAVPSSVTVRLAQLWELRREVVSARPDAVRECAAFGSWFVSGKFDEAWSLAQLEQVFGHPEKVEPPHFLVAWLADVVRRLPLEAVRMLRRAAEAVDWDYQVSTWAKDAKVVIEVAMGAECEEARQAAADLVNLLGSRGHHQFRELLARARRRDA